MVNNKTKRNRSVSLFQGPNKLKKKIVKAIIYLQKRTYNEIMIIFTSTTNDQMTLSLVKIQCLTSSSVLNTGTKLNLLIYSFNNVLTSVTSSSTIGLRPGVDVSAGNLNFLMKRDNGIF